MVLAPEHEALVADSVGIALLVVLETLSPAERLAFVLHDVFGVPFDEIAPIVGRSPTAARQLASRARRRVLGAATSADAGLACQREAVDAFLTASREGDFEALPLCSTGRRGAIVAVQLRRLIYGGPGAGRWSSRRSLFTASPFVRPRLNGRRGGRGPHGLPFRAWASPSGGEIVESTSRRPPACAGSTSDHDGDGLGASTANGVRLCPVSLHSYSSW